MIKLYHATIIFIEVFKQKEPLKFVRFQSFFHSNMEIWAPSEELVTISSLSPSLPPFLLLSLLLSFVFRINFHARKTSWNKRGQNWTWWKLLGLLSKYSRGIFTMKFNETFNYPLRLTCYKWNIQLSVTHYMS